MQNGSARSRALLKMRKAQHKLIFRDGMTGDESWIYFDMSPASMWLSPKATVDTSASHDCVGRADASRVLGMGIAHRVWLPEDVRMNVELFLVAVLRTMSQKLQPGNSAHRIFTIVHMDHARRQTTACVTSKLSEMRLKIAP
jgi:hypothetical protein